MEPIQIKEILNVSKGKLMFGNPEAFVNGISTDSRTINKGDFFVPIRGENFDGNNFIQNAFERGAVGSFIEKGKSTNVSQKEKINLIEVENPKFSMGELAKSYRQRFSLPYIAITGSNGKTSTKEMTASILETRYKVLKSEGSFNNDIGLPLTLFKLTREHQVAVLEMGMNNYGEIRRMVSIVPPDIGVVTNVAEAHIEFFGDLDNIAKAKYELIESMTEQNTAVLNADDQRVSNFSNRTKAKTIYFGLKSSKLNFSARDIRFVTEPYGLEFTLITPSGTSNAFLPTLGEHQVSNALAAVASTWQIHPDMEMVCAGLKNFKSEKMRMQIISINDFTVINDAYNANPKSMNAALETLNKIPAKGKKIAVLADMLELGELQISAHQRIGRKAFNIGLDYLVTVGNIAKNIGDSAISEGLDKSKVSICESKEEAFVKIKDIIAPNDLILVKGSRKMKLEELIEMFKKKFK